MSSEAELLSVYAGILDIFQELNRASNTNDVLRLYTEYLKLSVKLSTNHPCFNESLNGFIYGNCYTYAMGLMCPKPFWDRYELLKSRKSISFDVGLIAQNGNRIRVRNFSEERLIDNFYADCDFLGIDVFESAINASSNHGGYRIFIFKDKSTFINDNFHFVRINEDGSLSHRNGCEGSIEEIRCLKDVNEAYELIKTVEIVKPVIRERIK